MQGSLRGRYLREILKNTIRDKQNMKKENQHALVIGGTRGLGRETVRQLASSGYIVSVIGRHAPREDKHRRENISYYLADITDKLSINSTLSTIIHDHGKINYLIFCQRFRGNGDNWQGEIDTTLTSTKLIVEFAEGMFSQYGDKGIVMVSSVFGDYVGEGQPMSYHICKSALNQMMRYLAVNMGKQGVRVNAITPFTFLKDESKDFYLENESLHKMYCDLIPLGRMPTSVDSANAIQFLCSKQSSFINGQNIYIDGGISLLWQETLARNLTNHRDSR